MTIKKYFENNSFSNNSLTDLESKEGIDFESFEYLDELEEQRTRFIPNVDFSKPENFARYGLAEQYYKDAIARIINNYPYDGSKKELVEWYNDSTYFDLYVFENEYPRSNGYGIFAANGWGTQVSTADGYGKPSSLEYIYVKGGPNPGPSGSYVGGNIYDPTEQRNSNLALNLGTRGATVEFWLKKDEFIPSLTEREVIFDLWNNELSSSDSYGRFRLELNTSSAGNFASSKAFRAIIHSGSVREEVLLGDYTTTASFTSQGWTHFAFAASSTAIKLYKNGELDSSVGFGSVFNNISGTLNAYVGALITAPSGSSASTGAGGLSGSIDEFRYWKITRSERDIERNWFTNVYGGTNTDDANTDLGVYFKFNEGITGNSTTDAVVLDYSGRISNGTWTGYTSASRNTGSAIVLASAAEKEFKDPILRTTNTLYTTYYDSSLEKGKRHDLNNSSNLYYSYPDWIIDEDLENGSKLLQIAQAISSYFDTAHLQIEAVRALKDIEYTRQTTNSDDKPIPFANRLLTEKGIFVPDLFVERNLIEDLTQKDDVRNLESDLFDLKNLIYQNIYNNLTDITKKKGTKSAIRNILHTFGVGDELVSVKTYSDKEKLVLEDERNITSQRTKFIDFFKPNFRDASVYQTGSVANELAYISGSAEKTRLCIESFVNFPKIDETTERDLIPNFLTASIFGLHDVDTTSAPYNTWESPSAASIFVRAIKDATEPQLAYFEASSSVAGITAVTSSKFDDIYNDSNWYFSVQLEPQNEELFPSSSLPDYNFVFRGYSYVGGNLNQSFAVSSSIARATALSFLQTNQKVYIGAERTDFTGGLLYSSDVRNAGLRFWLRNLTEAEQQAHAQDFLSYGALTSKNNAYSLDDNVRDFDLASTDYLALNWQFDKITSTDSSGLIEVLDATSGSAERRSRGSYIDAVAGYHYPGTSYEFPVSSTDVVETKFVDSYTTTGFDGYNADDLVEVKQTEEERFGLNRRLVSYITAVEKSAQAGIDEEMLKMFGSVKELALHFSSPVDRYRKEYKDLRFLRERFFKNVANDVDVEDFLEFYKWIDNGVQALIAQLIPATANHNEDVFNVVESHVLERNKYQNKFPTLELRQPDPVNGIDTVLRSGPGWAFNHAPIPFNQNKNCFWWEVSANRSGSVITSGDAAVDADREQIRAVRFSAINRSYSTPQEFKVDDLYVGKDTREGTYWDAAIQEFGSITDVDGPGPLTQSVSVDYLLVHDYDVYDLEDCTDVIDPNKKVKRSFKIQNSREYDESYSYGKGHLLAPFTLWSSSIDTGYQSELGTNFKSNIGLNNHHDDVYSRFRNASLQSPFTEGWVGGRQYRHIALNAGSDAQGTRPEGFYLLAGADFAGTASLGVVKTTYTSDGTHDFDTPRAALYREELAKRPLNIKNRQYSTASSRLGNFKETYEVVMTNGRTKNNLWFHDNSSQVLTETEVWNLNRGTTSPYLNATLPTRGVVKSVIVNRFSAPGGPEIQSRGYLEPTGEELSPYNAYPFRNTSVIFSSGSGNNDFTGSTGPRVNISTNIHTQNDGLRVLLSRRRGKYGVDSVFGSVNSLDYNTTGSYQKVYENTYNYTNASTTRVYSGTVSTGGFKVATNPAGGDTITIPYTSTLSVAFTFVVGASIVPTEITIGASTSDTATNAATKITNHPTLLSYLSATAVGTNVSISFNSVGANNYTISTSVPAKLTIVNFSGGTDPIDETYPSRTYYDNFFISHQIPRTPANYSWVNYALTGTSGSFSYSRNATIPSGSTSQTIPFAELITLNEQNPGLNRSYTGLYTGSSIIAAQITASLYSSMVDQGSTEIANTLTAPNVRLENFHTYAHSINNSLFGYNSFRQIRGGESKQAKSLRENNTLSFRYGKVEPTPFTPGNDWLVKNISYAPAAIHFPLQHSILQGGRNVNLNYSFGNEYEFYPLGERELAAITDTATIRERKKGNYSIISDLYTDPAPYSIETDFNKLTYKQPIWPKTENTFRKINRQRTQFTIDWWSAGRTSRQRNDYVTDFGYTELTQSIWTLDGITGSDAYNPLDLVQPSQYGNGSGETGVDPFTNLQQLGGGLLNNNHSLLFYCNVSGAYGSNVVDNNVSLRFLPFYARPHAIADTSSLSAVEKVQIVGATPWTAAEEAGKEPFYYKDYDHYIQDLKTSAKEYSIIPEFRISERIDQILGSELGEDTALSPTLDLTGAFYVDDTNDSFYTELTNSDILKYFSIITNKQGADIGTIKLSCRSAKKFLPYEGFYPAQRVEQIAQLFSSSYSSVLQGISVDLNTGGGGAAVGGKHPLNMSFDPFATTGQVDQRGFRPFFAAFMSPGILNNSIKSGIGVSYPYFSSGSFVANLTTGSYFRHIGDDVLPGGPDSAGPRIKASFDQKLSFEAILDPQASVDFIKDVEPHPSAIIQGASRVITSETADPKYTYAINNFLAETMNLFLKNNSVSTIVSAGERSFNFEIGKEYNMIISLTQEGMSIYNGDKSFGPPVDSAGKDGTLTGSSHSPYVPPYNQKINSTLGDITLSQGLQLTFRPTEASHTIDYIINNLTASAVDLIPTGSTVFPASSGLDYSFDNRMKIEDVIDYQRKIQVAEDSERPEFAWVIQPKWECPVLDFSHRTASVTLASDFYNTSSVADNYYVGMWHQYGRLPTGSQGIKMKIIDAEPDDAALTGSLAELLSISKTSRRLGQLNNTTVKEAIVAIPYLTITRPDGPGTTLKRFFEIDAPFWETAVGFLENPGDRERPSVPQEYYSLAEKMRNYVFPPRMDFYRRVREVSPFAMFIFEFDMDLNEQDLADIWQNLPPDSVDGKDQLNSRFEYEESSFEVRYGNFEGAWIPEGGFPEGTRWMVFKVKQRANYDYFEQTRKSSLAAGYTELVKEKGAFVNPTYSYNWPYDFFSFTELAKIDAEVSIDPSIRSAPLPGPILTGDIPNLGAIDFERSQREQEARQEEERQQLNRERELRIFGRNQTTNRTRDPESN